MQLVTLFPVAERGCQHIFDALASDILIDVVLHLLDLQVLVFTVKVVLVCLYRVCPFVVQLLRHPILDYRGLADLHHFLPLVAIVDANRVIHE